MAALAPSNGPREPPSAIVARERARTDRYRLIARRDAMVRAQQAVMVARRAPIDPAMLRKARVEQLLAMSDFERALTACHLPIPPRLRQETGVLRRLLG